MTTMLDRLNTIRRDAGLPELVTDVQLANAANRHVQDLASGRVDLNNSHIGSDGSTAVTRTQDTGYPLEWVNEMTGWGFGGDDARMVEYWMNSPVHRNIILDPDLYDVGIVETYRPGSLWSYYWTVLMGRKDGAVKPEPKPPVYTVNVPVVAGGVGVVDLLPYMRGDGRMYEVQHPSGATETFQTQVEGDWWYQVKNQQWEQFWSDSSHIWRGVDTSPGNNRAYIQYENGHKAARWVKRFMAVGETYTGPGHWVQFKFKDTYENSALNSGPARNQVRLVALHSSRAFNGITVEDVAELTDGHETFWFGRGYGLVAWSSPWGQSAIVQEYQPGERPRLVREKMDCFN